jgi:hypothetical protein
MIDQMMGYLKVLDLWQMSRERKIRKCMSYACITDFWLVLFTSLHPLKSVIKQFCCFGGSVSIFFKTHWQNLTQLKKLMGVSDCLSICIQSYHNEIMTSSMRYMSYLAMRHVMSYLMHYASVKTFLGRSWNQKSNIKKTEYCRWLIGDKENLKTFQLLFWLRSDIHHNNTQQSALRYHDTQHNK